MKNNHHFSVFKPLFVLSFLLIFSQLTAQGTQSTYKTPSDFWKKVQFGGGLGLNFSSGYTDIFVAPSAIYNINSVVAVGAGLNLNYITSKNYFTSTIYGVSTVVLVNPIPEIQFSAELKESRVNYKEKLPSTFSENYWNTDLILGVGYRTGNVTIGVGYNVLQNKRYGTERFVPFVRAYF